MLSWTDTNLTIAEITARLKQGEPGQGRAGPTTPRTSRGSSRESTGDQQLPSTSFIRRIAIKGRGKDRTSPPSIDISSPAPQPSPYNKDPSASPGRGRETVIHGPKLSTDEPHRTPPKRPPRPQSGLQDISPVAGRRNAPHDSFWSYTSSPPAIRPAQLKERLLPTSVGAQSNLWERTVYLNGPIVVRRGSLGLRATSIVCQEALDLVYQNATSDTAEAGAIDICDFFQDLLSYQTLDTSQVGGAGGSRNEAYEYTCLDAISLPPDEDVICKMDRASPVSRNQMAPAQTQSSVRTALRRSDKNNEAVNPLGSLSQCMTGRLLELPRGEGIQSKHQLLAGLNALDRFGKAPWISSSSRDSQMASKLKRFSQ